MTDLEKFVELFKSVGIALKPEEYGEGIKLTLEANEQENITGYSGFITIIDFSKDGKFLTIGAFE